MSEYIQIDSELDDDGQTIVVWTNLTLTPDQVAESYKSPEAMAVGSPLAKALAAIDGIAAADIAGTVLLITCESPSDWHSVAADVTVALKDFFL